MRVRARRLLVASLLALVVLSGCSSRSAEPADSNEESGETEVSAPVSQTSAPDVEPDNPGTTLRLQFTGQNQPFDAFALANSVNAALTDTEFTAFGQSETDTAEGTIHDTWEILADNESGSLTGTVLFNRYLETEGGRGDRMWEWQGTLAGSVAADGSVSGTATGISSDEPPLGGDGSSFEWQFESL